MRVNKWLIFVGLLLGVAAQAQQPNHRLILPSAQVSPTGITEVEFITPLFVAPIPFIEWYTIHLFLDFDTQFVDVEFRHTVTDQPLRLSQLDVTTSLSNYVRVEESLYMTAAISQSSSQGSAKRRLSIIGNYPGGPVQNPLNPPNIYRTGIAPGTPIKLLVNEPAIAAAGDSYQISDMLAASRLSYTIGGVDPQFSSQLKIQGGLFTVVPEPSAVFLLLSGAAALARFKRQAQVNAPDSR